LEEKGKTVLLGRKISGLFQLDKRYLPPVGFVGGLTAVFAGVGVGAGVFAGGRRRTW